jgi:hypothetical protein
VFGEVGVAIIEQRTTAVTNNVTERFVYLSVDFSVAGDSDTAALSRLSTIPRALLPRFWRPKVRTKIGQVEAKHKTAMECAGMLLTAAKIRRSYKRAWNRYLSAGAKSVKPEMS